MMSQKTGLNSKASASARTHNIKCRAVVKVNLDSGARSNAASLVNEHLRIESRLQKYRSDLFSSVSLRIRQWQPPYTTIANRQFYAESVATDVKRSTNNFISGAHDDWYLRYEEDYFRIH